MSTSKRRVLMSASAMLLLVGIAVASDAVFKLRKEFIVGVGQWVSIPYRSPYQTADDLVENLLRGSGTVTRFVPSSPPTVVFWNGSSGTNFVLQAAEGYMVNPMALGSEASYYATIVGAHDESVAVPVGGFEAGVSYLVSIPYHSMNATADDLLSEIFAVSESVDGTVTRMLPTTPPTVEFWDGSSGFNFALTPGEAYEIRLNVEQAGFLPSHF